MSTVCSYRALLLGALAAGSFVSASLHADLPPIGSANVAIADPDVPPPTTTPCIVPLFDQFTFIGFDAQMFDYAPPDDCPGPWQKVVLSIDLDVTAGRQFDRTAEIWIAGANFYFGTTQEPRATVAPSWHIERDVTDLSALLYQAQGGRVDLGNLVDDTYTGIIHGSASLAFYPFDATIADRPPRPDVVVQMAADATGGTVTLSGPDDHLEIDFVPPQNVRRAFLDVIVQAQNSDEFWYLCVPDDLADELESCPGSGFREGQVSIDGIYAGVVPVYPWIYTGGIDPYLWRPSPGIQTLAFEPYRVDLTPYASWFNDGLPHHLSVRVFNAEPYFSATANLLLYLDHGADVVTGAVTMNTLEGANPDVSSDIGTNDNGDLDAVVLVSQTRDYEIAGYVDTSDGRITTDIQQHSYFYNSQIFNIFNSGPYQQQLDTRYQSDTTTSVNTGVYSHVLAVHHDWPLMINYEFSPTSDGFSQTTSVDQGLKRTVDIGIAGFAPHEATLDQHMTTNDTLLFDTDFNVTGQQDQGSQQSYTYLDPYGACYDRAIATDSGVLTAVTDGAACPNAGNVLPAFDVFYNSASTIFGATVQILP